MTSVMVYTVITVKETQRSFRKDQNGGIIMKKNLTELVFILDESGSMADLVDDTIGGFNSLIEKQKNEEGEAFVTTVTFSNKSKTVHDREKLENIGKMTRKDYIPNGCTALYDAIGNTIEHISGIHKYAREEDVPEKTLFVITTDGMENASREFDQKKVKKLIERMQEEKGWEFVFLGANIDAAETAASMGICESNAVEYHSDCAGTGALFRSVGCAISSVRSKGCVEKSWSEEVMLDNERRSKTASPKQENKKRMFGLFK